GVGAGEGEVAHVVDLPKAQVAPERRMAFNVATEAALPVTGQGVVDQALRAADPGAAPVHALAAVGVGCEHPRTLPEERLEALQAAGDPVAQGGVVGDVVQA